MAKILLVFGTRPEAIKMAPLVLEMKQYADLVTEVCVTGQHREMLDQVLDLFDIKPDYDLNIMKSNQDLYDVTSAVVLGMRQILEMSQPDIVLVHGDTTTSMAAALAAFYKRIAVGHVEAGLRTYDIYSPWPEEINRQLTGRIATYNFAPTETAKRNLMNEGVSAEKIEVTGNTVIDALHLVISRFEADSAIRDGVRKKIMSAGYDLSRQDDGRRIVLITGHRRENFGDGFLHICNAIKELSQRFKDVDFIYPVHLNPNVRKPVNEILGDGLENVFLTEPLEYQEFVYMMSKSCLILTDSGGIQEEAPGLGKPVLVMRDTTERPEAVEAGTVKLVGSDKDMIISMTSELLTNTAVYEAMANAVNPYGDGHASERIVRKLMSIYK
ncbi:MAG: UDP-N-acetylglucosamine 2-epimerase (non-hydrolyzing) [Paludibacteraceae bacterium]|nr:UDP-N-acetylglucosamine 2-epimerase (non-hydrolyzing) [Paludibacteraceae bacterium]